MNHSQKRKFKGVLSSFMATTLAASLMPISHATEAEVATEEVVEQQTLTTNFTDISGHWGSEAILRWANYGVLSGRGDGTFDPNSPITRAEIAVVLSELMGYEVISDTYFADLNGWSEEFCRKLNAAGFMNGKLDNMMAPFDNVTREEFATILYQALHLDAQSFSYGSFADSAQISNWAQTGVATLYHYGVTKGTGYDESGKPYFSPQDSVTRAEVVQMLHSSINLYIKGADNVTPGLSKTTIIHSQGKDVTFSDTKVYGDLVIAEGTGEGSVYLNNVEIIDGDLIIKGGGSQSIYLDNVVVSSGEIVVDRMKDTVRVVFAGNSVAPNINVGNNAMIVATDLGADASLGTVTVTGGEDVSISGTFAELINKQDGVNLDISGIIDRIYMDASGYVNGSFVIAGTEFDSNSIPQSDVNITEPELTLDTDFGSAAGESPSATAEILSTSFNESTSELTVEIEVRDIENCILMAEDANGITVSNPSGSASLDRLSLDVTSSHKTSYSLYTVVIKMTQNYTTIPLSVNFKSVDDLAAPVITKNFNGISSASATVSVDEDIDYRTSTAYAYINVSSIRNCELHYMDERALTSDQDEETINMTVTLIDSGDDWAEYRVQYTFTDIDTLELDMNFLREGAEESVPDLSAGYIHEDSDGEDGGGEASVTGGTADLDKFGNIVYEIEISDLKFCQLMGSTARAITIDAESGDREAGYGQEFDVELSHDGPSSTYTVTFEPNGYAENIHFLVNLDDKDEGIPVISAITNLSRINDDDVISDYFVINENTISISRDTVTFEVQVKNMDDLEGYKTPTKSSISSMPALLIGSVEVASTENFYAEKLDDELYSVSFSTVHVTEDEDSEIHNVTILLDLEVTSNYVALFEGTSAIDTDYVPVANLPYAVKSSSTTSADKAYLTENFDLNGEELDRKITFSMVADGNVSVAPSQYTVTTDEGTTVASTAEIWAWEYSDGTCTIYFTPQDNLSVNDVAFYIDGVKKDEVATDTYQEPTVTVKSGSNGSANTTLSSTQFTNNKYFFRITNIAPDSDYEFDSVTAIRSTGTAVAVIDDVGYDESAGTYTGYFTVPAGDALDVTLTVNFKAVSSTTVEISTTGYTAAGSGLESPDTSIFTTDGTTLTFTKIPELSNYECYGYATGSPAVSTSTVYEFPTDSDTGEVTSKTIIYDSGDLVDGKLTLYPLFRQVEWTASNSSSGNEQSLTGLLSIITDLGVEYPVTINVTSAQFITEDVTIPSNVTIEVGSGQTLKVSGGVTNKGTINVAGTFNTTDNFTNEGQLEIGTGTATSSSRTTTAATWTNAISSNSVINSGNITINYGSTFENNGTFENNNTIMITSDATLTNTHIFLNDGSVIIQGTLNNEGTFESTGTINVVHSAASEISGVLENSGTLTVGEKGSAHGNTSSVALTNNATFINTGTVDLYWEFQNTSTGILTTSGTFNVLTSIDSYDRLVNSGKIEVIYVNSDSRLNVYSELNNYSTIVIKDGTEDSTTSAQARLQVLEEGHLKLSETNFSITIEGSNGLRFASPSYLTLENTKYDHNIRTNNGYTGIYPSGTTIEYTSQTSIDDISTNFTEVTEES